jgi:hypothetical protein
VSIATWISQRPRSDLIDARHLFRLEKLGAISCGRLVNEWPLPPTRNRLLWGGQVGPKRDQRRSHSRIDNTRVPITTAPRTTRMQPIATSHVACTPRAHAGSTMARTTAPTMSLKRFIRQVNRRRIITAQNATRHPPRDLDLAPGLRPVLIEWLCRAEHPRPRPSETKRMGISSTTPVPLGTDGSSGFSKFVECPEVSNRRIGVELERLPIPLIVAHRPC